MPPPEEALVGFEAAFFWLSVEPAALFDATPVRPSRKTFEAAVAAVFEVVLLLLVCAKALPAAVLEAAPVAGLFNTFAAAFATFGLVDLVAIRTTPQ